MEGAIGAQRVPGDAIQFNFTFDQPQLFFGVPDTRTAGYPIDTGVLTSDPAALPFRYRTRFVSGDAIGIYVVKHDSGVPSALSPLSSNISENYANNVKAVYDSTPGSRATWTLKDSIYHPGSGYQLDFYAYYPYQPDIHYGYPTWGFYPPDPNAIPYKANMYQDTPAGFYGSDFLLGIARNISKSVPHTLVTMKPKHAMALVEAKVYGMHDSVVLTQKVALINVKSAASVSLSDSSAQKVDYAPPPHYHPRIDSIVMYNRGSIYNTTDNMDTVVYWAVVPPQYIVAKDSTAGDADVSTVVSTAKGTALFNRNDSVYVIKAPNNLTLKAGEVTTVKVGLN